MKVSFNWLKEYVDIDMPPQELADILTMAGIEVEAVESVGESVDGVAVGRVVRIEPHPGSDQLSVCRVDTGKGEVQVVCGAPNLEEGVLAPLALPGVRLPGGRVVEKTRIKGELSHGILLAEDEMDLTDDHSGIMLLPPDSEVGAPVSSVLPLRDWVLDVAITPNRGDCASVLGVAREVAAATGGSFKKPSIRIEPSGPDAKEITSVTVEDPEGCPRYAAAVIRDVGLGPSPFWMRYRLHMCGIRSINSIVDVTNYVMLETGQPLHAFDYDRLKENRIVVRRAHRGEVFTTLDGQSHTLDENVLMICDGKRPVALAGIMGGLNSEIFGGTRHILLESAFFDPFTIRKGAKELGLSTEASYRFERGVDIQGVPTALLRAASLISQLGGGKVAKGVVDAYPRKYSPPIVDFRVNKANRLLGTTLTKESMRRALESIEISVEDMDDDLLRIEAPSFRPDLTREVDFVEEVARIAGFDHIPVSAPLVRPDEERESPEIPLGDQLREIMVGLGFTEVITYSFISPDSVDALGVEKESPLRSFVTLMNPLSREQSVMRTSLVPGLLATVRNNRLYGEKVLKLFEWGKVFINKDRDQLPLERRFLSGVMTGYLQEENWYDKERQVDFYDIKGAVEALLKALGYGGYRFEKRSVSRVYDPEECALINYSGALFGQVGLVSSGVREAYDLEKDPVYLFELDMEALIKYSSAIKRFQPFSRYPAVYRDLSMVFDRSVEFVKIKDTVENAGEGLVESVRVFDIYEGKGIDPSKKALGIRVCYRSEEGTLHGATVNQLHERIIEKLEEETGGRLREA